MNKAHATSLAQSLNYHFRKYQAVPVEEPKEWAIQIFTDAADRFPKTVVYESDDSTAYLWGAFNIKTEEFAHKLSTESTEKEIAAEIEKTVTA